MEQNKDVAGSNPACSCKVGNEIRELCLAGFGSSATGCKSHITQVKDRFKDLWLIGKTIVVVKRV